MLFISLGCSALVFYTVQFAGSFAFFWLDYLLTSLCGIGKLSNLLQTPFCHPAASRCSVRCCRWSLTAASVVLALLLLHKLAS